MNEQDTTDKVNEGDMELEDSTTQNGEQEVGAEDINKTDKADEGAPTGEKESAKDPVGELKAVEDKYLRLYAEFDNYRRRTAAERLELFKTAGQEVLASMLPVVDDFERALKSLEKTGEVDAVKQGVELVYTKLKGILAQKGLKPMETLGKEFDSEFHEAITKIPAPSEDLKDKVVDEVEKGYFLNDKVIRFAKVVIGE